MDSYINNKIIQMCIHNNVINNDTSILLNGLRRLREDIHKQISLDHLKNNYNLSGYPIHKLHRDIGNIIYDIITDTEKKLYYDYYIQLHKLYNSMNNTDSCSIDDLYKITEYYLNLKKTGDSEQEQEFINKSLYDKLKLIDNVDNC